MMTLTKCKLCGGDAVIDYSVVFSIQGKLWQDCYITCSNNGDLIYCHQGSCATTEIIPEGETTEHTRAASVAWNTLNE